MIRTFLAALARFAIGLWPRMADDYADHGDAAHVGPNTLAYYARLELRQGWDREAHGCGPWRSPREIRAIRRAEARRGLQVVGRAGR